MSFMLAKEVWPFTSRFFCFLGAGGSGWGAWVAQAASGREGG